MMLAQLRREAAVMLQGTVAGEAARMARVAMRVMAAPMAPVTEASTVGLTSTVAPVVSPPVEKAEGAEISLVESSAPVEAAVVSAEALGAVSSEVVPSKAAIKVAAEKTINIHELEGQFNTFLFKEFSILSKNFHW